MYAESVHREKSTCVKIVSDVRETTKSLIN